MGFTQRDAITSKDEIAYITDGAYPNSAVASPHLFQKLAIPNLCAT